MGNGGTDKRRTTTTGQTKRKTYFGALSRKGGVGFGRGRGEQCVPVVRQTHLSLQGGSDEMKRKGKETRRKS